MIKQGKLAALFGASAIAGGLFAAPVGAHEATDISAAAAFEMAAVTRRASGNAVLAGDYGRAIEQLGGRRKKQFESSTNLCVAYTMTGDLELAGIECAAALEMSEKATVRRDIAVALTNCGVVRAVSGDLSGARHDFNRALEVSTDFLPASKNLELLREANASDV